MSGVLQEEVGNIPIIDLFEGWAIPLVRSIWPRWYIEAEQDTSVLNKDYYGTVVIK